MEKRVLIRDVAISESEGKLRGHFIVTESPYEICEGVREIVDREAVEGLDLRGDIRLLWNHDSSVVLARTTNNTLYFMSDSKGLFGEGIINQEDSQARDCFARVKRGDVSGCSIGFYPIDVAEVRELDGSWSFHIRKMDLLEVSICAFPAYTETDIHARAVEASKGLEREQIQRAVRRAELIRRLKDVHC